MNIGGLDEQWVAEVLIVNELQKRDFEHLLGCFRNLLLVTCPQSILTKALLPNFVSSRTLTPNSVVMPLSQNIMLISPTIGDGSTPWPG